MLAKILGEDEKVAEFDLTVEVGVTRQWHIYRQQPLRLKVFKSAKATSRRPAALLVALLLVKTRGVFGAHL